MATGSIKHLSITKVGTGFPVETTDALAIEEPLEIRLRFGATDNRTVQNISVTMRTPGNDDELALGFLFTEGIVTGTQSVDKIEHCFIACAENKENVIEVALHPDALPNLPNSNRNFYTTSSCGVCGKGSIEAIKTVSAFGDKTDENRVDAAILHRLPEILNRHQKVFADTGGIHASALFNAQGKLLFLREDVGRHNALDKLIGAALKINMLPLTNYILLLSGRASFELVQKAAMAGITVIAAVGAPSSLAVETAVEFNITLVGFLRNNRFNIYSAAHRVLTADYETAH